MTRLSIFGSEVILSSTNPSENDVIVLLNGELWNFDDLAVEFERQDLLTEHDLIRRGYLAHGINYVSRLNGIFLIVIIDRSRKEAFFVRDPLGVKPAFYHHDPEQDALVVSSEIKAIVGFDRFTPELNVNYLRNQALLHFSDFNDCIVAGVRQIPPHHYLRVHLGSPGTSSYLLTRYESHVLKWMTPGPDVAGEQLALLEKAVLKQYTHAESYPIGLLLSGGVDSSLLAFVARRLGLENIVCFFMGSSQNADFEWAKKVARLVGYRLEHIRPSAPEVIRELARYCHNLSGESGYIGMHFSDRVRRMYPDMKVVLCGEGADELYGGYTCYTEPLRYFHNLKRRLPHGKEDTAFMMHVREIMASVGGSESAMQALFEFFQSEQLVNNHLLQLDHAFMANGIELRVPYLDLENVAFVRGLPLSYKVSGSCCKVILKNLLSKISNITDGDFMARDKLGLPSALPSSLVDVEDYAEAIIPTAWAETHPYRRWFASHFQMMWFDLAYLLLVEHRGQTPDGVSTHELYSPIKRAAQQIYRSA